MSNGSSDYFVGHPVEAVGLAAPGVTKPGPPPQVPGGERDPAPGADGYFVGHPVVKVNPEPAAAPSPPLPAAAAAKKNKPSFLAKCVPCLFGGGASSVQ